MLRLRDWLRRRFASARRPQAAPGRYRPQMESLEDRVVPTLSVNLVVPPSSSYGVNNALVIQYANNSTASVPAPVLVVSADNANLWLPSDPASAGSSLQVLATGPTGPAGTLAPGASGSIVVDFTSTSTSASAVNFSLTQLTPGQAINWSALESSMQPSTIANPTAWNAVFTNFTANVGSTTTSYQTALDADATYLAQLGEPTNDVARLVSYEINKADDVFSTQALGDNVDAALPTPGSLSLTFERWYRPGVAARYQMGTLGLGWTNNWDITASADSTGNVTIDESGNLRYFTLQSDGSYLGTFGDNGTLTALTGGYQLTETDGSSTVFNANGSLDHVQDSNGNRITASYTNGLLTQLAASNGEYLTLTYTNGLLTKVTDSTGETSKYSYDASGQYLLSHSDEFGKTTYSYVTGQGAAAQNALASIAFADGSHEYFGYDTEGRLIDEHQDNNQQDVTIAYGPAGGFTTTDADTNTSTVLMDDNGQVGETIDALGHVIHYTHDLSGDLTAVNGSQGANYVYLYDSNGNLTSATDPRGLTTEFTYNSKNDLTSYTDARGNTTSYAYDSSNNLLSITYANGTAEYYNNYNPLGEAAQFVTANGQVSNYQYNSQGLVKEETFADGSSNSYTYDVHGNMTQAQTMSATGVSSTITFKYQDSAHPDLLTEVDYSNGQFLKFTYNTSGQRTQSVDQTGYVINYFYDALGRLQKLTDGSNNRIVQYTYDVAGNLIQQANGNGTFTVYTYDGNGDVMSLTNYAPSTGGTSYVPANSTVNSFDQYTYDALGNVATDTNQDGKWVYSYDADSQLTNAVFTPNRSDPDGLTSQNLQYVYDAAGNRISQTVNGVTTTYSGNNSVNEYASSTTNGVVTTYGYDNNGNLTSQTTAGSTTIYRYNALDQLTAVNGAGQADGFTYDPLGNLSSQTINGTTTQLLNDPLAGIASTYSSSGSLLAHYTSGLGLVSQVGAGGTAGYYDFNLTGSTIGITGAAGSYVNQYSYLPFGQTTTLTATLVNPFTFVGGFGVMQDSTTLFSMGAREYSATTGQFLSSDPTGLNGGDPNVRRYAGNNPATLIDPAGLQDFYPNYGKNLQKIGQNAANPQRQAEALQNTQRNLGSSAHDYYMYEESSNRYVGTTAQHPKFKDPGSGYDRFWANFFGLGHATTPANGDSGKPANNGGTPANNQNIYHDQHLLDGPKVDPSVPHNLHLLDQTPQDVKTGTGKPQTYDPDLDPLFLAILDAATILDDTASSNNDDNAVTTTSAIIADTPAILPLGSGELPGIDGVPLDPPSDDTATTVFTSPSDPSFNEQVQDQVQITNGDFYNITAGVPKGFPVGGTYDETTTVGWEPPGYNTSSDSFLVYGAPLIVNPVNISMPAGGIYSGPVATATDLASNTTASMFSASLTYSSTPVPATINQVSGSTYTVSATVNETPGYYFTYAGANLSGSEFSGIVSMWDSNPRPPNPQPGANIVDGLSYTAPGTAPFTTSVDSNIVQVNGASSYVGDLAFITTGDPAITSASQVTVTSSNPAIAITGETLSILAGGLKQIAVQGIVNAAQPGSGPQTIPLTVQVAGEPSLAAEFGEVATASSYTVNGVPVSAVAGQPLQNVQVATVAGPQNGSYSATINWGDGDTSAGQITALGGGLYSVTGSKPHPYASAGSNTITVTVNGPGKIPAPPSEATATVLANIPLPPVGNPDELYVTAAYQDILGHAPDATSLAQWSSQIAAGLPLSVFANALTHSPEYYTNLVNAYYEQYLGRAADPGGLAYWVGNLEGGLSDEHLEASFFNSAEFIAAHGGLGAEWVDAVYQDELGRPADVGGLAYFEGEIAAGVSPAVITFQFATSAEREGQRVTADYQKYLGRTPDAAGLAYWVNQFVSGAASNEDLVAGFVGAPEYFQMHS